MIGVNRGSLAGELRSRSGVCSVCGLLVALDQSANAFLDLPQISQSTVYPLEKGDDVLLQRIPLATGCVQSGGHLSQLRLQGGEPGFSHLCGSELVQRQPLAGGEQLTGIQQDDGALGAGNDSSDVHRGEAAHHRAGRSDGGTVHPQHLAHFVYQYGHPLLLQLQHHDPGFLPNWGIELEALPQVNYRNSALTVRHHAFEELGRLGERRRGRVAENTLHLQDVEGEFLASHPEGYHLDIVASVHGAEASVKRELNAGRSSSGTRVSAWRATPTAHGSVSPGGTGSAFSRTSSSASSTSRQTRRPEMFTTTPTFPEPTGV